MAMDRNDSQLSSLLIILISFTVQLGHSSDSDVTTYHWPLDDLSGTKLAFGSFKANGLAYLIAFFDFRTDRL